VSSGLRYVTLAVGFILLSIGALLAALVVAVAVGERGWAAAGPELLTSAPLIALAVTTGCLLLWLAARLRPSTRRRAD
jgi:hypothetical protein